MWAEQAASTETQELSKALHEILQVLVQVPEPSRRVQLYLLMEDMLAESSTEASPRQRLSGFFSPPDTIFYLKPYQSINEAVERHILTCSGEYLPLLTPQGMYCCLALVVLPYI